MHDFLKQAMQGNQFASGGLFLLIIGAIGASLRKIPMEIISFIERQVTMTLIITDEVEGFMWFQYWFATTNIGQKARQLDLRTPYIDDQHQIHFQLAPGSKWTWYKRRPFRISFNRKEGENASDKRIESFALFTFGRKQKFLRDFVQTTKEIYTKMTADQPKLYYWNQGWNHAPGFSPRKLDSVILPGNVKDKVLNDIQNFYASIDWYKQMGIPFHRGYLLHGIPGSGKTALATGIANHLNCTIYLLKLNEHTDRSLAQAVSDVLPKSIILLEDVDTVAPKARTKLLKPQETNGHDKPTVPEKTDDEDDIVSRIGVSLTGLLNVLDGIQSPQGVLFFLTTNDPTKLDPALLRPGRVDLKLEFGTATREQKANLHKRFFPQHEIDEELLTNHGAASMADFQEVLLQKRNEILKEN